MDLLTNLVKKCCQKANAAQKQSVKILTSMSIKYLKFTGPKAGLKEVEPRQKFEMRLKHMVGGT